MKLILIIGLLLGQMASAQVNLLLNPSLEADPNFPVGCNDFKVLDWTNPTTTTPDAYSSSNCSQYSVPLNRVGFQYPKLGIGYIGLALGAFNFNNQSLSEGKEYMQGQLSEVLLSGKRYCVGGHVNLTNPSAQFYINFPDRCCFTTALDEVGALFSIQPQFYNHYTTIITDASISLKHESKPFLDDTLNWMQVENNFIAQGGEQHVIFGNFKLGIQINVQIQSSVDLDSFIVAYYSIHNEIPGDYLYYYFDDMYVYEIPPTKITSEKRLPLQGGGYVLYATESSGNSAWYALPDTINAIATTDSLFVNPLSTTSYLLKRSQCRYTDTDTLTLTVTKPPKPAGLFVVNNLSQSSFQILYYDRAPLQLYLYNSAGQLVKTQTFAENTEVNISDLAAGVYYCRIMNGDSYLMTERVVKMQ